LLRDPQALQRVVGNDAAHRDAGSERDHHLGWAVASRDLRDRTAEHIGAGEKIHARFLDDVDRNGLDQRPNGVRS